MELYGAAILANDHQDTQRSVDGNFRIGCALATERFDVDIAIRAIASANGTRRQMLFEQEAVDVGLGNFSI